MSKSHQADTQATVNDVSTAEEQPAGSTTNSVPQPAVDQVPDPAIDQTLQSDKLAELTADLQRTRADFENFRKQTELQKAQSMNIAKQATAIKFLPLIDDFERALSTYSDQLAPLQKNFNKTLKDLGLAKINSEPGTPFNPDFHEAISVEGDGDTEIIAETLRPGYLYDGAVIRAAMVKVQNS